MNDDPTGNGDGSDVKPDLGAAVFERRAGGNHQRIITDDQLETGLRRHYGPRGSRERSGEDRFEIGPASPALVGRRPVELGTDRFERPRQFQQLSADIGETATAAHDVDPNTVLLDPGQRPPKQVGLLTPYIHGLTLAAGHVDADGEHIVVIQRTFDVHHQHHTIG